MTQEYDFKFNQENKVNKLKLQLGFTLVEMMIAMTIGLVLLLVIGTIFASSQQVFREQEDNARLQESGRYALEIIGRNIKQAGHVEVPFTGFKVAFTGMAISGTNGDSGVADTITVQYEGALNDNDCEGTGVTIAGRIIQNHFNIDAANAELQCAGQISDTPTAPGTPPTGQVLLSNVEDLQILYGIDTDGDQSVDQYVELPIDWDQVITARVCVLVRSDKSNIVPAGNYLNCSGVTVAVPVDRRLRRAFTATFNLRNRINGTP
ncbi:MAG: prepilin-type N-terminal cleavage/methylation domain-containing protein [Nitrosomonas sp. PRO4]|nr:prepilin-type N-terminal cleavage/methylation domain-containing protein [Nitrosomonas sp. PRO4]